MSLICRSTVGDLNFGDDNGVWFTDGFTCSTSQTIFGFHDLGFVMYDKDTHGAPVLTRFTPIALFRIDIDQIYFKFPESLWHGLVFGILCVVFCVLYFVCCVWCLVSLRTIRNAHTTYQTLSTKHLIRFKLLPLIIDQLEQYPVHFLWVDKGKFAITERPGAADKGIWFGF